MDDDRWADYLSRTVYENVLGADIPDLFPIENPSLLRHIYLAVARNTGQEIAQNKLADDLTHAGMPANQPTVGRYLHYLADAQLIREFRRYPLAKKSSARVTAKITLSDLGVRNAMFRGASSLWESDPVVFGPLVETLVQSVIRGNGLQVHFFRDFETPHDRRSRVREVDFVVERLDGAARDPRDARDEHMGREFEHPSRATAELPAGVLTFRLTTAVATGDPRAWVPRAP